MSDECAKSLSRALDRFMSDEDQDGIDPNDELYAVAPTRRRVMIAFDWGRGYVSPFQPTADDTSDAIMTRAGISTYTAVAHVLHFYINYCTAESADCKNCTALFMIRSRAHSLSAHDFERVGARQRGRGSRVGGRHSSRSCCSKRGSRHRL